MSQSRTASTTLRYSLSAVKNIACFGEVFAGHNRSICFDRLPDRQSGSPTRLLGYKWFYYHPLASPFSPDSVDNSFNFLIHLKRRNLVKRAISQVVGELTGNWGESRTNSLSHLSEKAFQKKDYIAELIIERFEQERTIEKNLNNTRCVTLYTEEFHDNDAVRSQLELLFERSLNGFRLTTKKYKNPICTEDLQIEIIKQLKGQIPKERL